MVSLLKLAEITEVHVHIESLYIYISMWFHESHIGSHVRVSGLKMYSFPDDESISSILQDGVKFQSPHDSKEMLLRPEKSIEIQNSIGADIIMQLDDVVSSTTTGPRVEEAMHRSIRWLDRCIKAHKRPQEQNLFAIIQGGLDAELRKLCCRGKWFNIHLLCD